MTVIITESASNKLRGMITRWLLEVKPGVFVGNPSTIVREHIWKLICEESISATSIVSNLTKEQGFDIIETVTPRRKIVSFDGVNLIQYQFAITEPYSGR